jgi:hypothetical protein
MSGDIDFGSCPTRSEEKRVKLTSFDSIVFTVETDFAFSPPERMTNCQELFSAGIPLIVHEIIPKASLLRRRTASHDIACDAPFNESGEGVDLLYKSRWLH